MRLETVARSGARTLAQAEENFAALDVVLSPEEFDRLNLISEPDPIVPGHLVDRPVVQQPIHGRVSAARRI